MQKPSGPWSALMFVLGLGLLAHAQTPPFQCIINAGVPPIVRSEGLTELAGDQTLNCSGGTPTPAGQPLPQFNFTVLLNTNITSKITAANQFSEALLIVDEPASAGNPTRPILNCGNTGAPDNGGSGPGICSIVSSGNPAQSFDGAPNGYGSATCDGAAGRPAPNSYGCGRPNVFQGRIGTPQSPGQLNAVTFFNVPVDPPGMTTSRIFRITNLRVNATALVSGNVAGVESNLALSGPISMPLSNPQQFIAYVETGVGGAVCSGPATQVCLSVGADSNWKPKNISFAVGNGVPGNATFGNATNYWQYNGGTNYPPDVAQNVPGAIYNTESGFEWQNNSANGPPSPNPPSGIGTIAVQPGEISPLNSVGYGGLNTGISSAGVADSGTRIALRFSGMPQGASIQLPSVVSLFPSGVMVLTDTDAAGAGPFRPRTGTVTATNNMAVYEVLWSDPFSHDGAAVPYTLVNAPPGATAQVTTSYAPFYTDTASRQPGTNYPTPRFADSSQLCSQQVCLNVSPNQGVNTGPANVTIVNYGTQSLTGAQVVLRGTGVPDITGNGSDFSDFAVKALSAKFELTNATPGSRDVVVTPTVGNPLTLPGGFSVLQAPPCSYSVINPGDAIPAAGGTRAFIVTSNPAQCSWSATSTVDWITLLPVSPTLPSVQPYSISPNTTGTQRLGFVDIAGRVIVIGQPATSACTYGISPGSKAFDVSGGTFDISVTASPGCAWYAYSFTGWVTFPNGSSGTGNGVVTIKAAPNFAGFLTSTVFIGDKTFSVTQSAAPCGGTDLSNQVKVVNRALLSQWDYRTPFRQQLQFTNTGASVPGPLYVVLYSLCPTTGSYPCPLTNSYTMVHCQAGDTGSGIPAVLVSSSGLAQGQTLFYDLQFNAPPYASAAYPLGVGVEGAGYVTFSVIKGTPGQ